MINRQALLKINFSVLDRNKVVDLNDCGLTVRCMLHLNKLLPTLGFKGSVTYAESNFTYMEN